MLAIKNCWLGCEDSHIPSGHLYCDMSPGANLEELAFSTASEAAEAIQSGKTTSLRLTEHMLERIQRFNPAINSIVSLMAEQALARAEEADRALSNGVVWGPLHGVPITVKDH